MSHKIQTDIIPDQKNNSEGDESLVCYHCGDKCDDDSIRLNEKLFCCNGCKAVYQLLNDSDLCDYYSYNNEAGIKPLETEVPERFAYLEDDEIITKLVEFSDGETDRVTFRIPQMHCSSCIYLLEKLYKIQPGIESSRVNFLRKEATISYNKNVFSLRQLVELLSRIGYEPKISFADLEEKVQYKNKKQLYMKIGLAGFAFGNVMLMSFPEYLARITKIPAEFSEFFSIINLFLSFPALIYSGRDYFISAYMGIKQKNINIDVPISLGMLVLFLRSCYEIFTQTGAGYLDSLTGLIFFLLIGKLFQQKTYDTLSFERDYKSYFPIAVNKITNKVDTIIPLSKLRVGDRIAVRNTELVPADAILINGEAAIDYSFVTGESNPVTKKSGDLIYAGGRQIGTRLELEIVKEVSQGYLTRLWNDEDSANRKQNRITHMVDVVSKYFTLIVLFIASISGLFWYTAGSVGLAVNVVTAVLIVACPCALALSYPFTMGNAMRIMGKKMLFLKNPDVIERLAKISNIVFDKTGTLTHTRMSRVEFQGKLTDDLISIVKSITKNSTHPLSLQIGEYIELHYPDQEYYRLTNFEEIPGKGIKAQVNNHEITFGSREWLEKRFQMTFPYSDGSTVFIMVDREYRGLFLVKHAFRERIKETIDQLIQTYKTAVVSGDNNSEENDLRNVFGNEEDIFFDQSPAEKLQYIRALQNKGARVLMLGDGLNDGAALRDSDVGFSITEKTSQFTPASDGIMEADSFSYLPRFMEFSRSSVKIVIASFIISFIYNIVGLSFAVSGGLSPIVAAILMPISSISVITFSTLMTFYVGKRKELF